jgi:hypothetical protein
VRSRDPFLLPAPSAISLSGGRTSAYLLRRVLDAHGGVLPAHVRVLFANTGKEREETLVFLREIETRWGVPVQWLEYRPKTGGSRVDFAPIRFETAARQGEPFEAMMDHERYVPNGRRRLCTQNLKVRVMEAFMASEGLSPGDYEEVVGFRADEPGRVAKARESENNEDRVLRFPLFEAGVGKAEVMAFWAGQPFDLGLEPHESNCDLCFLKGNKIRLQILREHPELADWWLRQERERSHAFTKKGRKTYADLVQIALAKPAPEADGPEDPDDPPMPCGCHD